MDDNIKASPTSLSDRTFDLDGYARRAAVFAFRGHPSPMECANGDFEPTHATEAARASCRFSAGCQHCDGPLRILIVASSRRPGCWILPGGGVDAGETEIEAAQREANEEGGIVATGLSDCKQPPLWHLATVTNDEKRTRTHLFALRVSHLQDGGYEDAGARARMWASLPQASELLSKIPAQQSCFIAALSALQWALPSGIPSPQ